VEVNRCTVDSGTPLDKMGARTPRLESLHHPLAYWTHSKQAVQAQRCPSCFGRQGGSVQFHAPQSRHPRLLLHYGEGSMLASWHKLQPACPCQKERKRLISHQNHNACYICNEFIEQTRSKATHRSLMLPAITGHEHWEHRRRRRNKLQYRSNRPEIAAPL